MFRKWYYYQLLLLRDVTVSLLSFPAFGYFKTCALPEDKKKKPHPTSVPLLWFEDHPSLTLLVETFLKAGKAFMH